MDFALRCNSLKCRVQLSERAVVTTCSHIFCLQCAEGLGLASTANPQRICPACGTALGNPDDVVSTQLNPTEDYKTSVLSGLSPTVITECAGRALAFWSYQSSQEIIYQEFLAKSLTEKYGNLSVQLDKIINDANAEIENLNHRLSNMQIEQDKLKTENVNLATNLRDKSRKQQQLQELYDRLKRKQMASATQSAAFDSADEMLLSAQNQEQSRSHTLPQGIYGSSQRYDGIPIGPRVNGAAVPTTMGPPPRLYNGSSFKFGALSQETRWLTCKNKVRTGLTGLENDMFGTPQHRQRLGSSVPLQSSSFRNTARHDDHQTSHNTFRRPLAETNGHMPNRPIGNPGFGMTAGMKKGIPQSRL